MTLRKGDIIVRQIKYPKVRRYCICRSEVQYPCCPPSCCDPCPTPDPDPCPEPEPDPCPDPDEPDCCP